jgi:hypothetical protein
VEMAGPAPTSPNGINDRLEAFLELLAEPFAASVGGTPDESVDGLGRYSAQLAVDADSPVDAAATGIGAVQEAAKLAELPEWPVVEVEIIEWAEFERRLEQPTHPDIIGVAELADMLEVTKQRASELARQQSFPRPFVLLASGPVWLEPTVRRFVNEWERRPGRPRSREVSLVDGIQAGVWDKVNHPG